jgi:hypothetical protein
MGWTQSGEEFIAKISSRTLLPARSLFVELDREDDEVLARWHSDGATRWSCGGCWRCSRRCSTNSSCRSPTRTCGASRAGRRVPDKGVD